MIEAFPDASIAVFTMGGMGINRSDAASMVLLPDLLFRDRFNRSLLELPSAWRSTAGAAVQIENGRPWYEAVCRLMTSSRSEAVDAVVRKLRGVYRRLQPNAERPVKVSLDWMPAARYQRFWSQMPAFALPAFYDGRIRLNLEGREAKGIVSPDRYLSELDRLEVLLRECTDARTGESIVDWIDRPAQAGPLALNGTGADMVIGWRGVSDGIVHPRLGQVGPIPFRRTGGHTGPYGIAYLAAQGIEPGDRGIASAFDVVPTLIELLGQPPLRGISGRSLLASREAQAKR
jgi:hypothetical protein